MVSREIFDVTILLKTNVTFDIHNWKPREKLS